MKLTCSKCRHAIEIPPDVLRTERPRVVCDQCGARFRLKSRADGPPTGQISTASDLRSRTTPSLPLGQPPASEPPPTRADSPGSRGARPQDDKVTSVELPSPDGDEGPTMVSTGGLGRRFSDQPIFEPGDLVAERYRIRRFIAQGGMGEVYEAEDQELRQGVALKTVSASIGDEPAAIERFKREIALARRVTHPCVCRIFDLGQHVPRAAGDEPGEPVTFLSMELLRGETLSACLRRRGRLAVEEALPLVAQMASALDAAHQAKVVHRDFKSENVYLVPRAGDEVQDLADARVVVTDFGIARGSDASDRFAAQVTGLGIVGTPAYMAPEQVENAAEITAAADIYALGIVIYEMVTGKLPFDGGNPLTTAVKRLQEAPPPPHVHVPDLPAWWEKAILRCLERKPSNRFASVLEVPAALEPPTRVLRPGAGAAAPASASSPPSPAPSPAPSPTTSGPTPPPAQGVTMAASTGFETGSRRTLGLVAVLVLVAALSAFLAWRNRDGVEPGEVRLRRSVAVLGFENLSGREDAEWLATALGEMMTAELAHGQSLRSVGGERVASARRQLGERWRLGELEPTTLERIRTLLGCDFVVAGSYVSLPGEDGDLRLDVRLHDAVLGHEVATFSEQGTSSTLFTMVNQLGDTLREALGADGQGGDLAGLPRDPQAARLYAEGLDHLRAFRAAEAQRALEQATTLEPENPLLHSALASAWGALGFAGRSAEEAERAFELSSGLAQEERLLIEARFRESRGDFEAARGVYRQLWQTFPDNLDYGLGLVAAETAAGDPLGALETVDQLRQLPPPLSEDPRLDLAEAAAAGLAAQVERQAAAAGEAARRAEADGALLPLARAHLMRAQALRALGRLPDAEQAAERAIELFSELEQPPGRAEALTALASARFDQSRFDDAAEGYLEATAIYRQIGDRGGLASVLNNLAVVRKRLGDFSRAESLYRETEELYEEIGDRRGLAVARNNRGVLLVERDQLGEALDIFQATLTTWEEVGGAAGRAYALNNLAEVLRLLGRLEEASDHHREALHIRREAGLRLDEAVSRANLAGVLIEQGELRGALEQLEQAEGVAAEVGDPTTRSLVAFQRGQAALYAGDLDTALAAHEDALEMRRAIQQTALVTSSQIALARLALADGRALDAEELASLARFTCQVDGRPADEMLAAALLVETFAGLDQETEARLVLEETRLLEEAVEQPAARLRFAIAEARFDAGRGAGALERLEELAAQADQLGLVLVEMAARRAFIDVATSTGRGEEAAEHRRTLERDAEAAGLALFTAGP